MEVVVDVSVLVIEIFKLSLITVFVQAMVWTSPTLHTCPLFGRVTVTVPALCASAAEAETTQKTDVNNNTTKNIFCFINILLNLLINIFYFFIVFRPKGLPLRYQYLIRQHLNM